MHPMKKSIVTFAICCTLALFCGITTTASAQQENIATLSSHQLEQVIYQTDNGRVAGNPKGSITIVDFSDYFCYPCRIVSNKINQLIKQDKRLRVVYIDFPILGEQSIFAAKAALAADLQHKYLTLHEAMMSAKKPLDGNEIFSLAKQAGISVKKLKRDMAGRKVSNMMHDNKNLGMTFSIESLPVVIIGNTKAPHQAKIYFGNSLLRTASLIDRA